jgi:hypothetical protein
LFDQEGEGAMRACVSLAVILGVVVAAVLSPSAGAVAPGADLDQNQGTVEGCVQFGTGVVIGQVFTAGVSGRLSDLMLTLGNSSSASDPLHVELTRVDGAGHPDLTAVMGSLNLAAADVPIPGPSPVDLEFGAPTLTSGSQYAVVVSTSDAVGYDICGAGSTDFYGGGQAFGTTDGGASWSDVGGDANFATYMLPPQVNRLGYCLNGRFLDLVAGQPDVDPIYKGAQPSIFVPGKGVTCDAR